MALELLAQKMRHYESDEISIVTNKQDYHYMLIKKSVALKKSLLSEEELLVFDTQDSFEIIISVEIDENKNIVYDDRAKLYTYNPTGVITGFGFNIHAPFRLDNSGKYPLECAFNDYIFQHATEAVGENLIYRLKSMDIRDIYKILYFEKKEIETLQYFYYYLVDTLRDREIFYSHTLERYFSIQYIIIANDEDIELFGETLYDEAKLLICVEPFYENWLIKNFGTKKLSSADIISNIEYIVQHDLFDDKRLGRIYRYLLDCINLDSEKIKDKKILPVFDEESIVFVSGFDVDIYYLYDCALAFEFDPKLRKKINFLHDVVTFPDSLNRYETLGIKEYNQRNILLKLREIFLSSDDEELKTQISKSILKLPKLYRENWEIVSDIFMLPSLDDHWHLVSSKTIFYPNELLINMFEGSLFLDVVSFEDYFKGAEYIEFLQNSGVWFIPDLRQEISDYEDLYFELCENWEKYRQLLDAKKIDNQFFANLQKAKFIPIEGVFYTINEVIFLSEGAHKYLESLGHLYAFKNLIYDENHDLIETLNLKHIEHDRALIFENLLDHFVSSDTESMSKKILDFIIDFAKEDELSFLPDFEFIALKEDGMMRMPLKEIVFADSDVLYDNLPTHFKKSLPFFPLFEKKYVSYFKHYGKSLRERLHCSMIHHGKEDKSEKYRFYLPYINKIAKLDFNIDEKFEKFSFYEVKDLKVKFALDELDDTRQRDFFIRHNCCYLDLSVCDDIKILGKMYQGIFEHRLHIRLPAFNYEIEKFLTDRLEFLIEKKLSDDTVEEFREHFKPSYIFSKEGHHAKSIDIKDRAIEYFLATKDISYTESFEHKGYDFVERVDDKRFFCVVKENIDAQFIFKMSSEEIKKAENEGKNYRVYLVQGFKEDIPVYDLVEDVAGLIKESRILVSKSEYHLIIVQRSDDAKRG